ncbi:RHTO0S30e00452g1_1 [Rhodotorula toruloides]|uniref:cystathionine beta-synthase n=1 Tax=Rhodotorula toruloides TaxID=5286 RepID=A0A061BJX9_RHOTO|nr:RHTO0S30e00452g1_1 [Rhodotorula toruloides]
MQTVPIHDSALSLIGHTPLVRLDRIAREEGLRCNLLAKVEGFSAGGSVKDRIALRMVEEAEKQGRLIPGVSVLVEPTSGNTGIGLALVAAVKGYRCIITMPEKMSKEKSNTLKALGAEIYRTPTEAAWDSPESHISLAKRIVEETPNAVMLDQYNNPANPDAHYHTTALEILTSLSLVPSTPSRPSSGTVDVLVAGAGTGGTLTGLSRRLREANPELVSLGVDPVGSVLARPESLNVLKEGESAIYKVEGTGYDFVPAVLSHPNVTHWLKSTDTDSFATCKRLIRTEGLLVGGSSGASVHAALRWLKSEEGWRVAGGKEGKNVVVVLPDSIRNYITSSWLNDDSPTATADKSHSVATDLGDVDALARKMSGLATPPDSAHGDA